MIVPMKKASVVIMASMMDDALTSLRELGVLHLRHVNRPNSDSIAGIRKDISIMEHALALGPAGEGEGEGGGDESGTAYAKELVSLSEGEKAISEALELLDSEYAEAAKWGDFAPADIEVLRAAGVEISLYRCTEKDMKGISHDRDVHLIYRKGSECCIALISMDGEAGLPFAGVELPVRGAAELRLAIDDKRADLSELRRRASELSTRVPAIRKSLGLSRARLAYEEAMAGMGVEGELLYLTGFLPASDAPVLEREAAKRDWALLIEEVSEEDIPPTLMKHSWWTRTFQPVMNFIGVVPGYTEYDTNGIFLIFFAVFFAMIVGDGGYGIIILAATYAAGRVFGGISAEIKRLFYVLSSATIIWGALTGSWFGALVLAELPILHALIVPSLSSLDVGSDRFIMELCFFIALLHLSMAHLMKGIRLYPSPRAVAEAGWIAVMCGVYLLVRFIILKEEMPMEGYLLLSAGFTMVILFFKQGKGGLVSGILGGLKGLPVIFLDGIGSLSNLVSYVRLFAVGLATREVALAFNSMAGDVAAGTPLTIIAAFLILLFGHAVNMLLAAMSVIVHGVRLNLLEFSGQINMEWSGVPYDPFRVQQGKESEIKGIKEGGML